MRYILADMSDDLISDIIGGITRNVAARPDLIFREIKDETNCVLKLYYLGRKSEPGIKWLIAHVGDRSIKEWIYLGAENYEYVLTDPAATGKHH